MLLHVKIMSDFCFIAFHSEQQIMKRFEMVLTCNKYASDEKLMYLCHVYFPQIVYNEFFMSYDIVEFYGVRRVSRLQDSFLSLMLREQCVKVYIIERMLG